MNKFTAVWAASLTGAVLAALAPAASASNFQLTEQSVTSLGRAHSGGAAVAEDSSSIWYNPAGLTQLSDTEIMGGYALIRFGADFTKTSATDAVGQPLSGGEGGSVGKLGGPAFLYYAQPLSHDLTFGFGINTPFGLATKYDDNSIFRYQAIYSSVAVINYNPSLAWKINDQFSLGAGIDYQTMSVKLTNDVDFGAICLSQVSPITCTSLGLTPQQHDGFFSAQASGHGWGWNVGALWKINDDSRVGFAYRSKINHDLSGGASFTNVPAAFSTQPQFQAQSVSASFAAPAMWSLSWAQNLNSQWMLTADWSRTMWSSFKNLTINFANPGTTPAVVDEGLSDSNRFAVGVDYKFNPSWTFRGGVALDKSPVPDPSGTCNSTTFNPACTNDVNASRTARLPDGDRKWIALGATWQMSEHSQWDVGYAHLFLGSNLAFNQTNAAGHDHIVGTYKADADILGISYRYKF
ncbi:MAG TPA: outer membrane protein transport protein [Gammaproteobacteria bacterium]|nr:outer membrane protein transport protein [Gammaproteobacteria bacterium]